MKWYADGPARFTRQLIADLLALTRVALWIWPVTSATSSSTPPPKPGVPFVGENLDGALGNDTKAGETLTSVGNTLLGVVQESTFRLPPSLL